MSASARAYHSSERVVTGSTRSTIAASGIDMTRPSWQAANGVERAMFAAPPKTFDTREPRRTRRERTTAHARRLLPAETATAAARSRYQAFPEWHALRAAMSGRA